MASDNELTKIWETILENISLPLLSDEVPVIRVQASDVVQHDTNRRWVPSQGPGPSIIHLYRSLERILNLLKFI